MKTASLTVAVATLAWIVSSQLEASDAAPSPLKIVVTQTENGTVSDTEMSCQGLVHGYLTFARPLSGDHVLTARWTRPDGSVQESADVPLRYPEPGKRTAAVWLRFDQRDGGLFSSVDDTPDVSPLFNGLWTLEVRLDGAPQGRSQFRVKC